MQKSAGIPERFGQIPERKHEETAREISIQRTPILGNIANHFRDFHDGLRHFSHNASGQPKSVWSRNLGRLPCYGNGNRRSIRLCQNPLPVEEHGPNGRPNRLPSIESHQLGYIPVGGRDRSYWSRPRYQLYGIRRQDFQPHVYAPITEDYSIELPANYHTIMANLGLLTVAAIDCICAAFASYKSARDVCPCFRNQDESYRDFNMQHSHALVNSWLGNHGTGKQPQFYVVAAPPSTLGNVSKMSGHCTPVFAIPSPMVQPQLIGYPLIPAPLGPVPSPIIPPPNRREMMYKLQKKYRMRAKTSSREHTPKRSRSRSKSKSREREVTERDVASTYTGLDRTIAEEFIDILDSKNNSTCSSDYSCTSSCQSPSNECCNTNSDAASRDYLVNKI
ncbi:uncharacterized protein LOC109608587 isoform X2 [Aethina tumida]|uniref:uncharacterized protein LOC109608587 isoform X2 n=1 Tax=Aethina tumida TaxID=116153 RepID=UPI002147EC13|nr:uncharacterized protein LOC109608587 isoform X2 [Aethina tumida]